MWWPIAPRRWGMPQPRPCDRTWRAAEVLVVGDFVVDGTSGRRRFHANGAAPHCTSLPWADHIVGVLDQRTSGKAGVATPMKWTPVGALSSCTSSRILHHLSFLILCTHRTQYKRSDVGVMAYLSQVFLVSIFLTLMCIHLFSSLEDVDSADLPARILGVGSVDVLVATTISVAFGFVVVFLLFTVYMAFARQYQDVELLRVVGSGQLPELSLHDGMNFHLFLSHIWSSGQGVEPFNVLFNRPHCQCPESFVLQPARRQIKLPSSSASSSSCSRILVTYSWTCATTPHPQPMWLLLDVLGSCVAGRRP